MSSPYYDDYDDDELFAPWFPGPPGSTIPADGDRFWIPPGQPVTVQGRLLPDGMVYVGSGLINEITFQRSGSLLLDGDDTLEVDRTVLAEVLG